MASKWSKNSVLAVDAGTHLASITRLLEPDFPLVLTTEEEKEVQQERNDDDDESVISDDTDVAIPQRAPVRTVLDKGPFAGLSFPHRSARANAAHFMRECVSTYLITHPHLDHLAGFVINTAAFHNTSRPKKLAALPSTVNAIKIHLFNDVIWPNLTDEDGGVGFVTFQRLADGGNIAVGEGFGSGYIEVCDGLCVRGMKITHGCCVKPPSFGPHRDSDVGLSEASHNATRHPSADGAMGSRATRTPSMTLHSQPGTPGPGANLPMQQSSSNDLNGARKVTVDSTAYFIRDDTSGREVLIFGDVEPDSLSLNPRTALVWAEAAPRIVTGVLRAVCIECSYEDAQQDSVLFGHLAPRHLVRELQTLAEMVRGRRAEDDVRRELRKRKRAANSGSDVAGFTSPRRSEAVGASGSSGFFRTPQAFRPQMPAPEPEYAQPATKRREMRSARIKELGSTSPKDTTMAVIEEPHPVVPPPTASQPHTLMPPLGGVTVIVMHIKDTLRDGPDIGNTILRELEAHEARLKEIDGVGLGCKFVISQAGGSYFF